MVGPVALDLDLPPAYEERVVCCIAASLEYYVPVDVLLAIAELENGKVGTISRNRNGTYDIGPMQFNSSYLAELSQFGITQEDVNKEGCYPYRLAAWRIKNHIENDKGDIWTKAANYHSKTPVYNARYRSNLIAAARRWAGWLQTKFRLHLFKD